MKTIELIGRVHEHQRLTLEVPAGVPPGLVKVIVEVPSGEDEGATWAEGVARAWAADWNDPREDLYSPVDGTPVEG